MTPDTDPERAVNEGEVQQSFLDRFQELLSLEREPSVTLTNIYKEVPITHAGTLCEVKSRFLELCTCELQLAAINQCKEVYILSPRLGTPVLGQLESIDIRRGLVQLSNFRSAELPEVNRRTVRVRFKKPLQIMMYSGSDRISGVIHDISLGGCCINTLVRKEMSDSDDIHVELKLIDQGTGELTSASIPSTVVRVSGDTPPFRCALSFQHTQQTEQFLSVFIYQRQLEILKELRDAI
jgi:hypothetical protein